MIGPCQPQPAGSATHRLVVILFEARKVFCAVGSHFAARAGGCPLCQATLSGRRCTCRDIGILLGKDSRAPGEVQFWAEIVVERRPCRRPPLVTVSRT